MDRVETLAGYLRARWDEAEAAAHKAAFGWGGEWTAHQDGDDSAALSAAGTPQAAWSEDIDVLTHAARWDPAHVLADVDSKRSLLDDLLTEPHTDWCPTTSPCEDTARCICDRDDRVLRRVVILCRPHMARDDFPTDTLPEVAW